MRHQFSEVHPKCVFSMVGILLSQYHAPLEGRVFRTPYEFIVAEGSFLPEGSLPLEGAGFHTPQTFLLPEQIFHSAR